MHLRESLLRRHLWTFLKGTQSGAVLPHCRRLRIRLCRLAPSCTPFVTCYPPGRQRLGVEWESEYF